MIHHLETMLFNMFLLYVAAFCCCFLQFCVGFTLFSKTDSHILTKYYQDEAFVQDLISFEIVFCLPTAILLIYLFM